MSDIGQTPSTNVYDVPSLTVAFGYGSLHSSKMNNNYNLVVCELHNSLIHGFDNNSDPNIQGHYLCTHICRINQFKNVNNSENKKSYIDDIVKTSKKGYNQLLSSNSTLLNHSFIRNYKKIISNKTYIQPHIAKIVYLQGDEYVAILKTFWLKCVQRSWKRVFKQRNEMRKLRKQASSILYKETHNKWPDDCDELPSIYKMFWSKT